MYNYKEGKKRIKDILNSAIEIKEISTVPCDERFTYANGIKSWITSVFIDIRNSTELFQTNDEKKISKLIRSFASETIDIMKSLDTYREIGIRGDCVYAIYSTPLTTDINNVMNEVVVYINTLINMLNKLFLENDIQTIEVGIGVAANEDLIIKVGRNGTGINDKVWIGDSVITACNLGNIGSKYNSTRNKIFPVVISDNVLHNIKKEEPNWEDFVKYEYYEGKNYITMNPLNSAFEKWITDGMKE